MLIQAGVWEALNDTLNSLDLAHRGVRARAVIYGAPLPAVMQEEILTAYHQLAVEPDEFYVHKPTFEQGCRAVLRRHPDSKKITMVYATGGGREMTRNVSVPETDRLRFCIDDEDVFTLADYAIKVERHDTTLQQKDRSP